MLKLRLGFIEIYTNIFVSMLSELIMVQKEENRKAIEIKGIHERFIPNASLKYKWENLQLTKCQQCQRYKTRYTIQRLKYT